MGIRFQIKTLLKPRSATNRCVPSLVTEVGLAMIAASGYELRIHQIELTAAREIRLSQDDVRGLPVGGGNRIPNQNAVIAGIRDEQLAALDPHSLGTAQRTGTGDVAEMNAVKFGWPNTTSAGWPLIAGIDFHSSTRLLPYPRSANNLPSEATARGSRMLRTVGGFGAVTVTISGCPTITLALPAAQRAARREGRNFVGRPRE